MLTCWSTRNAAALFLLAPVCTTHLLPEIPVHRGDNCEVPPPLFEMKRFQAADFPVPPTGLAYTRQADSSNFCTPPPCGCRGDPKGCGGLCVLRHDVATSTHCDLSSTNVLFARYESRTLGSGQRLPTALTQVAGRLGNQQPAVTQVCIAFHAASCFDSINKTTFRGKFHSGLPAPLTEPYGGEHVWNRGLRNVAQAEVQVLHGGGLCKPSSHVPGTTVMLHLGLWWAPFHMFRDNLNYLMELFRWKGLDRANVRLFLHNPIGFDAPGKEQFTSSYWLQMLAYLRAFTAHPILTHPQGAVEQCVHFDRLLLGTQPTKADGLQAGGHLFHKGTGYFIELGKYLATPLQIAHCWSPEATPRITMLLRKVKSHGLDARRVLNVDEMTSAIAAKPHLGRMRIAYFEDTPLHKQWQTVAETDIWAGMHGSGNANAIFLHKCGVLIELMPRGGFSEPAVHSHRPYMQYRDDYCAPHDAQCLSPAGANDLRGPMRNIMVNTARLAALFQKAGGYWRACRKGL